MKRLVHFAVMAAAGSLVVSQPNGASLPIAATTPSATSNVPSGYSVTLTNQLGSTRYVIKTSNTSPINTITVTPQQSEAGATIVGVASLYGSLNFDGSDAGLTHPYVTVITPNGLVNKSTQMLFDPGTQAVQVIPVAPFVNTSAIVPSVKAAAPTAPAKQP